MPGLANELDQFAGPAKDFTGLPEDILARQTFSELAEPSGRQEEAAAKPLRTPLYAWPLLALSVLAPSTSAPIFRTLPEVAAVTVAAWRLQATVLLLLLPGLYQFWHLDKAQKRRLWGQAHLLLASGVSLGIHFAAWVWGLYHTSLPHSLLCVTSAPVLLVIGCLLIRRPISTGELVGTATAGLGGILLAAGSGSNAGVTLIGDLACLGSSICFLVYMSIGRSVRASGIGIFTYVLPVNMAAALVLSVGSIAIDGTRPWLAGNAGTFSWFDLRFLPSIAWLAVGPGLLGHTSMAALLKWMHPLQVVLPQSFNPILGSVEGWLIGVSLLPSGWMTYTGGVLILIASASVLVASHLRAEAEAPEPGSEAGAKSELVGGSSPAALQMTEPRDPEAAALLQSSPHAAHADSQASRLDSFDEL